MGAHYDYLGDESSLIDRVGQLLAQEKIIGFFQGRMEFGPRALGSRSIIGDARSSRMQQDMNLKIKFRESFRPFAPSVLREFADTLFTLRPNEESPYMLFVAPVREGVRKPLSPEDLERMQDPDLRVRVSVPRSSVPARPTGRAGYGSRRTCASRGHSSGTSISSRPTGWSRRT